MIAIVNVSKECYPIGWHDYEVRINSNVIAKFKHKREDGLTKCLELAAQACEKEKWDNMRAVIEVLQRSRKDGAHE